MTSTPTTLGIESFEDVIKLGYKVVTLEGSLSETVLKESEKGSAMHTVYHGEMLGNKERIMYPFTTLKEKVLSTPKTLYFGPGNLSFQNVNFTMSKSIFSKLILF